MPFTACRTKPEGLLDGFERHARGKAGTGVPDGKVGVASRATHEHDSAIHRQVKNRVGCAHDAIHRISNSANRHQARTSGINSSESNASGPYQPKRGLSLPS